MKSSRIFSGLYFFLLLCAISAFHEGTFVDKQKLKYLNIKVNGYDLKSVENITIDKNFLHFKVKTDIDTQRRPFSFQINATLHCKALYVKKIGIAFCYQDSCRHGVVSHFVKYQFQNLTDMQQLDQCAVSFDTKIDNNFGDVSIFFKKVNFLVPTSIPMKDVSFLNEIKENRKVLLPIDYASEFIVGQNETVGRAVKDVIVDNEIQRTLEPLKKENSLENAYEDWTRIFSPFVLKFYFHSYDIVPSAAGTLLKVDVPFRIELDTPSILFSFDLHPSFQGPYQCTILGKLRFPSSSTDDAWMAVLECNQDQCSTPMYSTFFYDRIKGLREGTQLNHAHVHLYVNCRDRSSSTGRPYPDVELLLQWNMYILSEYVFLYIEL
ncbi:hypothetical protein HMI55_003961 [Coelomomyces lativittatus]|nr:hypothetical protein HMI55_003961 [Coelomomyces lativittatus]